MKISPRDAGYFFIAFAVTSFILSGSYIYIFAAMVLSVIMCAGTLIDKIVNHIYLTQKKKELLRLIEERDPIGVMDIKGTVIFKFLEDDGRWIN